MDEKNADADRVGRYSNAQHGVAQESDTQTTTMPACVYREPTKQYRRRRVGHIPPGTRSRDRMEDRAGREAVVANDASLRAADQGS